MLYQLNNSEQIEKKLQELAEEVALLSETQRLAKIFKGQKLVSKNLQGIGGAGAVVDPVDAVAVSDLVGEGTTLVLNLRAKHIKKLNDLDAAAEYKISALSLETQQLNQQLGFIRGQEMAAAAASTPVQAPVAAPIQPPAQPSWYVWDMSTSAAAPHDGSSMLPVGTLVSQDRGISWVAAESVGLAIQPPQVEDPVKPPKKK
tara:strand:- start:5618 stop:6223 length:606 start_codon:yes stop_codon:yes gene_type:complete